MAPIKQEQEQRWCKIYVPRCLPVLRNSVRELLNLITFEQNAVNWICTTFSITKHLMCCKLLVKPLFRSSFLSSTAELERLDVSVKAVTSNGCSLHKKIPLIQNFTSIGTSNWHLLSPEYVKRQELAMRCFCFFCTWKLLKLTDRVNSTAQWSF